METTTIMFCSHNMRNVIDDTLVFNAISIQMPSHCDLIMCVAFISSSVASVEGVEFHSKHQRNLGTDGSER